MTPQQFVGQTHHNSVKYFPKGHGMALKCKDSKFEDCLEEHARIHPGAWLLWQSIVVSLHHRPDGAFDATPEVRVNFSQHIYFIF
jgi:hypothetical protein